MTWFRPKTHGYGAYPANWKGWAAIGVFFAVQTALLVVGVVERLRAGFEPDVARFAAWTVISVFLAAVFLVVVRRKTDGPWRWRRGGKG